MMSDRLAFQTQLASIMEVLANTAVAEICKLVDDDYAVVRLQMSQCQRENKALKRKLHLLELKMARGNAERRLRESAMNSSRPRVQVNTGDRFQESPPSSDGVFERHIDVALWSGRAAAGDATTEQTHSGSIQSKSPDVELVEPEAVLVKEEKLEVARSQVKETEQDVQLIGDDGVVECVPFGAAGPSFEQQNTQASSCQPQTQANTQGRRMRHSSSSRGVEKEEEPDVVLVKVEEVEPTSGPQTGLSIQEGLVESSTDDYRAVLPFDETTQSSTNQLPDLQESGQGFSESEGVQVIPVAAQESTGVASQLRLTDTKTVPNSSRTGHRSQLSSDYSLLELETFFTHWAPNTDSVVVHGGPSCSFATGDSTDCDQDGALIVENESQLPQNSASSVVRISERLSFSPAGLIQPSGSRGAPVSAPLRMQPSWSRASAMMRGGSQQQQQPHDSSRVIEPQINITSAQPDTANSVEKTSTSSLSVRGSTAALPCMEVAVATQHRTTCKSQPSGTLPGERRRRSYVCRACGKAFSGLSNLEAHERVHTGERPFRCNTCGKCFSEAGNLKKHQRVHTGEKPFGCDQCGKRFAWICNLRTHQQSASGCAPQAVGRLK